jgi:membrane-bound serine protease (ClpP class)
MESLFGEAVLPWVYSVGLLVLGLALILLEIFVIPGMNIFGILGFGTVCIGVYFAYTRLGEGAAITIGLLGISGTVVLVWLMIRTRAWERIVHVGKTDRASGFDSSTGESSDLAGAVGLAMTALRPSGRARFDERIVDVVTDGGFIAAGAAVEVLEVHGNRIVVHERAESAPQGD